MDTMLQVPQKGRYIQPQFHQHMVLAEDKPEQNTTSGKLQCTDII